MKVEVQLMHEKGRVVPCAQRRAQRKFSGSLAMREINTAEFGRTLMVASLMTTDQELTLPQLYDAAIICVENGRMRLRGFEVHEGVQHGQTWDVKVTAC
ncbi:hypothetical protein JZU46_00395 [bacterium]|jgi:hypothetical protein|nr:hypothetical protein [bacterium]